VVTGYFEGSLHNLVSFFANENKLGLEEIDQLMNHLKEIKKKKP
jgi:hypothetical protein